MALTERQIEMRVELLMNALDRQLREQQMTLSDHQIEMRVELMMNALDRQFMRGDFSQEDYDKAVRELDAWAESKYHEIDREYLG